MENILKRKLHVQHDCNLIKFIMCTNECKCVGVYATIIRIIEQVVSWMFENGKTTHSRERQRRAAWQSPSLVVRWSCHVTECWIELKSFIYNRRRDIGMGRFWQAVDDLFLRTSSVTSTVQRRISLTVVNGCNLSQCLTGDGQYYQLTIRCDTIRDAILTCTRKPTWVS